MKSSLERGVLRAIERGRIPMIKAGDRVGVAVSGGADSVALLRILLALRERLGITLAVVHFDHGLRKESREDARFVQLLAASHGLAFIDTRENVAKAAARNKWNMEDAARRLRYGFFARVVKEGQATQIAVAHTMEDQAETVLARMLRGAGPSGLAGIYAVAGAIVRPLLSIRRAELREYMQEQGQAWREDATNRDTTRQRARIRENLLPLLEKDFSPRAVERLANLARLSEEEGCFWNALVEERFEALVKTNETRLFLSAADLLRPMNLANSRDGRAGKQRALTERLVRRLYKGIHGDMLGLTAAHVEQVIRLAAESTSGRRVELPGGVRAELALGELTFLQESVAQRWRTRKETRSGSRTYQYSVTLANGAANVSVPELGRCFRLKVIDCPFAERETRAILDADSLREPLVLRSWQPGDGYRPRGRRKVRKLKEMFLAARIAANERLGWPVLESGGRVAWAKGLDPAEEFCVREGTRAGVLIEESKL